MSKIIASGAIRGAHKIFARAKKELSAAIAEYGPDQKIELPNTGYYLPVIYGMTGIAISKLSDFSEIMDYIWGLLPPIPSDKVHLPYLGGALDAGMATLFADEVIESLKYINNPPYTLGIEPTDDNLWLGAADDVIMRERGVEFVDGSAPGFAAIVGAAPTNEVAVKIARELQEKNIYVFMSGASGGKSMAEQLNEEGVQMGWETRLIPFGKDITSTIFSLGFATRAALSFGGVQPGDYRRALLYNKNRIFAFVLALGQVDDEEYAQAAGAINFGFPTIADTDIPEILPSGICTYEHVVSNIPHDKMVEKAIEVRGLKVQVTKIDIPVAYGAAFEGERIRREDTYAEFGGQKTIAFEFLRTSDMEEVENGRVEVVGKDIDDIEPGEVLPIGIVIDVAGRKMAEDFESVLERQVHHMINGAEGVFHMGQRDIIWIRISRKAKEAGFTFAHLGKILVAKLAADYPAIVDKAQVTIYTDKAKVEEMLAEAKKAYATRDERVKGMTDEKVDTFYSCLLCQSFAPNHICIITPERLGLCGAYNWLDGKAAYEINPTGANQPVKKGEAIDVVKGQWKGVNSFIFGMSNQTIESFNAYSMMENPMTSCGCFECVVAILPMAGGVMIVNREFAGMTPSGMKFSTLAGTVGGGVQLPGFIGIGRQYITSRKFISADGGFKRIAWMPKELKESLRAELIKRAEEDGEPGFVDKIADETVATTEEEVIEFMTKVGHPALTMDPMF